MSLRLLLLGLMFTVIIFVIAVSPIGRLSGADINPVVTLAFKITGHVHHHDLMGYWVAQLAGGVAGVYLVKLWGSAAESVEWGVIHPSVSTPAAIGIEALMVGAIVLTMFLCPIFGEDGPLDPSRRRIDGRIGDLEGRSAHRHRPQPCPYARPPGRRHRFRFVVGVLGRGRAWGNGSCRCVETWPPHSAHREAVPRSVLPVGVP